MQFGALCAPGFFSAEGGDKGCRPFPRTPFSASGLLRFAPDRFLLTKPNTLPHNRVASVATLRWCSGSSRNAVRLTFGLSVQLHRNPHSPGIDSSYVSKLQSFVLIRKTSLR